jgi:hypothetical protein
MISGILSGAFPSFLAGNEFWRGGVQLGLTRHHVGRDEVLKDTIVLRSHERDRKLVAVTPV